MDTTDDASRLRDLALAYARHVDRCEPDQVAALFEEDGELRMVRRGDDGPSGVSRGRSRIAAVVRAMRRFDVTMHLLSNHTLAIAGDEATGEVYCIAHHVASGNAGPVDHVMFIRYLDRYRRRDDVWRFAERETVVEWTADQAVR